MQIKFEGLHLDEAKLILFPMNSITQPIWLGDCPFIRESRGRRPRLAQVRRRRRDSALAT
jgi:hypothetical protein